MKVTAKIQCPGCKLKTNVGFVKPGWLQSRSFQYTCESCTSLVWVKVTCPERGLKPLKCSARVVIPSKMLMDMIEEEKEFNKTEVCDDIGLESGEVPGGCHEGISSGGSGLEQRQSDAHGEISQNALPQPHESTQTIPNAGL